MQKYITETDEEDNEIQVPYSPNENYEVGDVLVHIRPGIEPETGLPYEPIYRKIAEVRPTGYSWYYPDWEFEAKTPSGRENHWWSENSSDPFFEHCKLFKKPCTE